MVMNIISQPFMSAAMRAIAIIIPARALIRFRLLFIASRVSVRPFTAQGKVVGGPICMLLLQWGHLRFSPTIDRSAFILLEQNGQRVTNSPAFALSEAMMAFSTSQGFRTVLFKNNVKSVPYNSV